MCSITICTGTNTDTIVAKTMMASVTFGTSGEPSAKLTFQVCMTI